MKNIELELQYTPRQRVQQMNEQLSELNLGLYSQDICMICKHLVLHGGTEPDAHCQVGSEVWNGGQDLVLSCRRFKAIRHWRTQILVFIIDQLSKAYDLSLPFEFELNCYKYTLEKIAATKVSIPNPSGNLERQVVDYCAKAYYLVDLAKEALDKKELNGPVK